MLELKTYLHQLRRNLSWLLLAGLLFSSVVVIAVNRWYPHYRATLTLYVDKIPEEADPREYQYDGFYAQRTAEDYTDTVVSLIKRPDLLRKAVDSSQQLDGLQYIGAIEVQKVGPRLISVQASWKTRDEAVGLVRGVVDATRKQVQKLNDSRGTEIVVELIDLVPLVRYKRIPPALTGMVAFLAVFVFGAAIVFVKEYMKGE